LDIDSPVLIAMDEEDKEGLVCIVSKIEECCEWMEIRQMKHHFKLFNFVIYVFAFNFFHYKIQTTEFECN